MRPWAVVYMDAGGTARVVRFGSLAAATSAAKRISMESDLSVSIADSSGMVVGVWVRGSEQ